MGLVSLNELLLPILARPEATRRPSGFDFARCQNFGTSPKQPRGALQIFLARPGIFTPILHDRNIVSCGMKNALLNRCIVTLGAQCVSTGPAQRTGLLNSNALSLPRTGPRINPRPLVGPWYDSCSTSKEDILPALLPGHRHSAPESFNAP